MRFIPGTVTASILVIFLPSMARAHREDYIDETLVFLTLEGGETEAEYWVDSGHNDMESFMRHHVAMEFGITDYWMIDGRITGLDVRDGPFGFDSGRLETRYRFYDEGTLPVDVAVSAEINTQKDDGGERSTGFEPRLVVSRDFGRLNLTVNIAAELLSRGGSTLEFRGGWRYDATKLFRFGSEVRYDTETQTTSLIPQVWLAFPRDITFKTGYSAEFGGTHENYLRLALEVGF